MSNGRQTVPVAVIGIGAVMPDANDRDAFWKNILDGRYSIRDVPPERWRIEDHYDPDPNAPDKTYCKIGAFVSGFRFEPLKYRIPPRVADSMDEVQKWAVEASRQALEHAGYLDRDFDRNACAVVIGNALAGELQFITNLRVYFPRYARALSTTEVFRALPADQQEKLLEQFHDELVSGIPPITEDSMPGELSNVIAGRVANVFGLRGPNYTADAACASSLAALESALTGLSEHRYDMVLTGGVDSSMAPHSFVKFSKIGALSADGSYPFDRRASGFVMGEGCAIFLLKRLEDAERDGDRILAVIRGIGSSSDGRGKGITAPNPEGQRLAIERAYRFAGLSPADVTMLEAHGTSTVTGDRVEGNVVSEFFSKAGARPHSIAMGSIKSQIGHLKSAAGAASLFKAVMSISEGIIPASINFEQPNPEIPFDRAPVFVPTEPIEWKTNGKPRVAGVSSFGFGGTNFHAILSEYRPSGDRPKVFFDTTGTSSEATGGRHILAIGAKSAAELKQKLGRCLEGERAGEEGLRVDREVLSAPERIVIEYGDEAERSKRIERALAALDSDQPARWKALANQGIFRGRGERTKLAFLFPGQGSQYIGMLAELRRTEPVVAETFAEADTIMEPILGRPLTSYLDAEDTPENREALRDTNVCQPAMLAADVSLLRLFEKYGIRPDVVAGHSMGEYAALVAAGMLDFENAMRAVSSRAREMSSVRVDDPGKMAAVLAPRKDIEELISGIEGVVPANLNSYRQTVIAGATAPMNEALERIKAAGLRAVELQVSHAFHSYIVAPACEPLRRLLGKLDFHPPRIPLIANVDAKPYEYEPEAMDRNLDRLAQQIASPVRWIETIESMYDMGVRLFVEVGAKRVLANLTQDIVDADDYNSVASNNPKLGDWPSFAQALAACAAYGHPGEEQAATDTLQAGASQAIETSTGQKEPDLAPESGTGQVEKKEIVISGAGLGLPGSGKEVFAEDNVERLLDGQVLIDPVPDGLRQRLAGQRIVRLVKDAPGGPVFEVIDQPDRVSRLLGQKGRFDLAEEFGIDPKIVESYDVTTRLAIAAGLLALRDAGIPLVMKHKTTTTGGKLPLGYRLPEQMRDDTGIIFASAFPGYEQFAREMERRHNDELLRVQIEQLERIVEEVGPIHAVTRRLEQLKKMRREPFGLDRKFIFRALSFGHAQFAELIGARGPNVQVNAACSSTTLAVAMASDWIRLGRCRRVLVVGADDVTNPTLAPWLVGGLLATGAVTSEAELEKAALPFDRRRNGMIPGMGAVGIVVEDAESCSERGMVGIARILGTVLANSAFHGSRLEPDHIAEVMDRLMAQVEREHGIDRREIAPHTVFVSHETYTPARGGSAAAEVRALRRTFGELADEVVVANTKGYTGHPMAVGIEDAAAAKMLEHQTVPPIPNYKEPDPDLGGINLSKGGRYDVRYALRLAAGFGSQVTMTLMEKVSDGRRIVDEARYNDWLKTISGRDDPRLEVVHKTLRIYDEAAEKLEAARNGASTAAASAQAEREEEAVPTPPADTVEDGPAAAAGEKPAAEESRATGTALEETGAAGREAESKQPAADTASSSEEAPERPEPSTTEPPVAETTPALDEKQVTERILAIVSEKTGYPVEMLELDLDLEADLGIDTVKQAETFAEVRKAFGIPKQDDLKLSDYPTLGHIIRFAMDKIRQAGPATQATETRQEEATVTATTEATGTKTEQETATAGQAAEEPAETAAGTEALAGLDEQQVTERILAIVSEKTGYPVEMLELDLDLEADLGIDTVKQAETFAEVRKAFGIPKQDDLKLSDYPTLGHIIRFAMDKIRQAGPATQAAERRQEATATETAGATGTKTEPETATAGQAAEEPAETAAGTEALAGLDEQQVTERILAIVSEKTGYPVEMLELDLDLEADLGIDTVKQAETFAEVRKAFGIPKQDDLKLSDYPTLGHIIRFAMEKIRQAGAGTQAAETRQEEATVTATTEATGTKTEPETATAGQAAEEPAEAAAETPAVAGLDEQQVTERILAIVSEKTGYPVEMLELDLDLEADLGIDTVKQAETFAEVRKAFGIPKQDDLKLSDYPTLGHIIRFAMEKIRQQGSSSPETSQEASDSESMAGTDTTHTFAADPLEAVTRDMEELAFSAPVLVGRPRCRECLPTQARITGRCLIVGYPDENTRALKELLEKRGATPVFIDASAPADEVLKAVEKEAEGVTGAWLLSALYDGANADEANDGSWRRALELRARLPFGIAKILDGKLPENGYFIAAVSTGGHLGLQPAGTITDPTAGATCGLVKALAREWPGVVCKVVDLPAGFEPEYLAEVLVEEAEYDRGVVEVTRRGIRRWGVGLARLREDDSAGLEAKVTDVENPVVLVTGGAGQITSLVVSELAAKKGGTYYLVMTAPSPDDPDVLELEANRQAVQARVTERLKENNARVTPVMVMNAMSRLERRAQVRRYIEKMRAAGADVQIVLADATDSEALSKAVDEITRRHGRIDYIVHAAGREHSQVVGRKRPEDFDRVFDTKVDGLRALLKATAGVAPKAFVMFGSVAGRFGNAGQTDYSAANDLLAKYANYLMVKNPSSRVLVIAYSGWADVGMASRGSVPQQLKAAGIGLIPPGLGATSLWRALEAGWSGEILATGALGALYDSMRMSGVDVTAIQKRLEQDRSRYPLLGRVIDWTLAEGARIEVEFDPGRDRFLDDHRIDGTAVLPGVMAMECFAEAALLLRPDLEVIEISGVEFLSPLKFYNNRPRRAMLRVVPGWDENGRVMLVCLETERQLHGGRIQRTRHYRASIRLDSELLEKQVEKRSLDGARRLGRSDIYRLYFHGPSFQVLRDVTVGEGNRNELVATMQPGTEEPRLSTPGKPATRPMHAELAFQAAGLLEAMDKQKLGLPAMVDRMVLYRAGNGSTPTAVVTKSGENGTTSYKVAVYDEEGHLLLEMEGYRTSHIPGELSEEVRRSLGIS